MDHHGAVSRDPIAAYAAFSPDLVRPDPEAGMATIDQAYDRVADWAFAAHNQLGMSFGGCNEGTRVSLYYYDSDDYKARCREHCADQIATLTGRIREQIRARETKIDVSGITAASMYWHGMTLLAIEAAIEAENAGASVTPAMHNHRLRLTYV